MFEHKLLGVRCVPFLLGDPSQGHKPFQHVSLPHLRVIEVRQGAVPSRGGDQARQDGSLRKGDLGRRLPEIGPGGRIHTPRSMAEINRVHVHLHEAVLSKELLHPERKDDLLGLSFDRPLLGKEKIPGKLLGDGASSLLHSPVHDVLNEGPCNGEQPYASMLIEGRVLRGEGRLDDPW